MICDLSDLPTDMCSHCRGMDAATHPPADLVVIRTLQARHNGTCGLCGEWTIREGDPLYLVDRSPGIGEWAGTCCVGEER